MIQWPTRSTEGSIETSGLELNGSPLPKQKTRACSSTGLPQLQSKYSTCHIICKRKKSMSEKFQFKKREENWCVEGEVS